MARGVLSERQVHGGVRVACLAISLAASTLAHAETVQDPRGQFSIDIDASGLCVVLPPPPKPCVSGDARTVASQALAATPTATAVFVARKLDQLEIITVVRNDRTEEVELDPDEIGEGARDLTKAAVNKAAVRSSSEMTTREERVNGVQMITYSANLELDTPSGPTNVTWESRVLYGRKATCWVSIFADAADVEDARTRVTRAMSSVQLEPALRHAPRAERWWWLTLLGALIGIEIARRYRRARSAK